MAIQGWSKADLHIHTRHSDGANRVETLLYHVATRTDLRCMAITDHDTINGAIEAQRLAPKYGLEVIVGQEVSTVGGHVLALFIRQEIPSGLSIRETVGHIHRQGGIAVLAHPFDRLVSSPVHYAPIVTTEEWLTMGLDAIEAINGSQVTPGSNAQAGDLARTLRLAHTGGSDAHHKEVIGAAYTIFPGDTAADLYQALLTGKTRADGGRWGWQGFAGWFWRAFVPRTWRSLWHTPALPEPDLS